MSERMFYDIGCEYIAYNTRRSSIVGNRKFLANFGVTPNICNVLWNLIQKPRGARPAHLLWALLFMKTYNTENVICSILKVDEKTMRKWVWIMIDSLADIDVIKWGNRKENAAFGATCFVSLDGTDFRINEPTPFDRKWYSHKFKCAGLRYEIGLCIKTGKIVWANGGYPCGAWPDLKIARDCYIDSVEENEMTLADKGYRDELYFITPTNSNGRRHKQIMSRHETVNKRLKQFKVLCERFRHKLEKHTSCFYAVANITEIMIENGYPLYQI